MAIEIVGLPMKYDYVCIVMLVYQRVDRKDFGNLQNHQQFESLGGFV